MIKLIDSKLVAKLMNEAAKECGMTRLYSSTDDIWWKQINDIAGLDSECLKYYKLREEVREKHRRIVKCYDFIAYNFIELLEAKVKAEGFDLADNKVTMKHRGTVRDHQDSEYKEKVANQWVNWKQENSWKDIDWKDINPPIIPNTENSVYVRLTVAFIGPRQYKKFVPYYSEQEK